MSWMDDYYKALGVNSTQTTQKKKASNSWMQEYQQTLLELEEEKEKQRETIQRKTETTITPAKEEDDSLLDFFQAGALDDINLGSRFKDGYQVGDITKSVGDTLLGVGKTILGTAGDAGLEIVKGAGGMVEGLVDLAGYGSAYVADWAGKDDYADQLRKNAQKNTLEEWTQGADDYLEQFSVLGRTSDAVAQGIGQVGTILLTGGLGQAAGLGTAGVTALTTGSMGLSGMGSGMGEAYRGGATDEEAVLYGSIAGAADALSELMFGGLGKAVKATGLSTGLLSVDDMLAKKVSSMFSSQLAKNLSSFGIKAAAEGFEEVVAGTAQAIGKWATYASEEKNAEELWEIVQDENLLEQFVVGAIASGIAQAPSLHTANKTGTDFITGMTQNEETVVQKEVEKRIAEAEKGGTKLTAKEKAAIEAQVEKDLDKGYISTDTIEEVLGGETYQRYKQTVDSENALREKQKALQEEFDTLNKMKQGEMTGEQIDRRSDLKEELAKINESVMSAENHSPKTLLQERLSKEVSEMVRSDRLIESYNERERRKQYFEADLTKYTNPKARQSVQNLMDAKVANNTNRTREMADTVAKIAEDKDIVFHFTSNQKLKEEGHAYKSMKEFTADGNTAVFELGTTKIDTDFQPIVKIGGESVQNFKVDFDKGTITFENAPAEGQISVEFRKTGMVNGFNDGKGNITINMDSPRYWNFIVGHEVTHSLEKAKAYEDLQKAVFAYAQTKGEYQGRYDSLKARYNEGTNIEQELTADLVGDYIFNDQAFVNDLSTNHQNIFQKIFSEIKYLLKVVTAGSKEARQLEKAKRMFEKAYRESTKAESDSNADIMYSVEQVDGIDYVKAEKNIFVKEDGTVASEREIFNSLVGKTIHLPEGDVKIVKRLPGKDMYNELSRRFPKHLSEIEDPRQLNRSVNQNMEELLANSEATILDEADTGERHQKQGITSFDTRTVKFYDGDSAYDIEFSIATLQSGEKIAYAKKFFGYDEDLTKKIQATEARSEQSPLNRQPVSEDKVSQNSEDVKHSLSAEQEEYFKDSVVRDENGNLMVLYHGTQNDFTVFDIGRSGENYEGGWSEYGEGIYLTPDKKSAEYYGDNAGWGREVKLMEVYANIKNPFNVNDPVTFDISDLVQKYELTEFDERHIKKAGDRLVSFLQYHKESVRDYLMGKGYDGVWEKGLNGDVYQVVAYAENQIKNVDNAKPTDSADVRYSLSEDNDGNRLTKDQADYFKNSKIRDENGNLKVMYHGTPNGEFTVFKDGTYFTDNKEYADTYQNPGASSISTGKTASSPKTFEVYLNMVKPFDINDAEAREIYINDYIKGGNAMGINPYLSDAEYAKINTIDWTEGEDLREFLIDNGYDYDGLVLDEGATGGYGDEVKSRGKSYVVFSPEQVKSVSNNNPTDNPDIHRSLSDASEQYPYTGNFGAPARDLRVEVQEEAAPVAENATTEATVAENATVSKEEMVQMFPEEVDPIETELDSLLQEQETLESRMMEAIEKQDYDTYYEVNDRYKTVTDRIAELERERAEADFDRIDSIEDEDAPPEMEAPYYGEPSEPAVPEDPFEDRDYADVGKRNVNAYMYENPEVKPFFQAEARVMLGDLGNSIRGEKIFNDQVYYDSGGEKGWSGTRRQTTDDIAYLLDSGYTYAEIEKGLNAIIEDNGKENNAVSKRIEFALNDRLLHGYTGVWGETIPADQGYINLLNEKQINEYSQEAFDQFMANADQYAPEGDIAPTEDFSAVQNIRSYGQQTFMPPRQNIGSDDIAPTYDVTGKKGVPDGQQAFMPDAGVEPKLTRKQLHQNIMDRVKSFFQERGFDFDTVLKKAKDLSTFATVDNIPQRVMEKALGYKQGQALSELTVNQVAKNETEGIKWLNSFTNRKNGLLAQISKEYNIKPGSKKSSAAQMYAEGFYVGENDEIIAYGDRELAMDFPNVKVQNQIKGLARDPRIRQIYDETLASINESRARNAYPEIPRLDNYFLHFRAMEDTFSRLGLPFNPNDIRAKDLPTDLNGVTADLKPGQPYFASAMHRTGKRTSFDLLGGLEKYLTSAKNQIYHIDDIQTLRAVRNYIAQMYGQATGLENLSELSDEEAQQRIEDVYGSHLSTFAKFLNEEANVLAGKTALIDRGLEGIIGRRGITFLNALNRQVGSNMVGYNISSSLTNFLAPVQAFAKSNKFDFVKGMAQTAANKVGSIFGKGDGFAEASPVMIRRKGADAFYRTPWQKLADPGYVLMGAVDDISTELIARAKYNELTRKGMDSQQAHYETDKWVSRLMGDRSLGQQPQLYNSKMLGLVTKFQLEVRNQLDSQFYDTIQEAKVSTEDIQNGLSRNAKKAAKITSTFVQLAVLQHLFGKAFESVAGYNPAFDIIEAIIKAFGWDDEEDDEDTVLDNIEEAFFELMGDMPYVSALTGGRIPIESALPIEELYKGEDQYGNEKSRWKTLAEAAPYYILPGGTGQLKKTWQGLSMFDEDHPIAGSYTNSGNLRFPVEDTTQNRVQAALFGQWASQNARDYFDEDYAPLKENQIQEFIDSDMPIRDYRDYREGLKDLSKQAEKVSYINGLDLSDKQKDVLKSYLFDEAGYAEDNPEKHAFLEKEGIGYLGWKQLDSDTQEAWSWAFTHQDEYRFYKENGVTPEDYSVYRIPMLDFDDEKDEAYQWAFDYPDKATMGKVFSNGVKEYRQYTKTLSEIKADKDENGKTINGSRKDKVLDYINSLDIDYYEKLILFKNEYNADDTYNGQIIEYINSRSDLTYEEKVNVLEELGFEVSADGRITW